MPDASLQIHWSDGSRSEARAGEAWLDVAGRARQVIPTACRVGSCGACEIEVNGIVIRACIAVIPACPGTCLKVSPAFDPYW
ncbi:MAG: 2Fe-2S iron-sulfur cluster-binding protein [Cyanobium sp.]